MANSPRDGNREVAIGGKGDLTGVFVPANIDEATGNFIIDVTQAGDVPITLDGEEVVVKSSTGVNGGPITVGTTQVEMTFTGTTKSIMIQSDPDNTGRVWFGITGVTNTGGNAFAQLEPGDAVTMDLNDVSNALYAISDTASQNVLTMALT